MISRIDFSVSITSISEDKTPTSINGKVYPRVLKVIGRLNLTLEAFPTKIDVYLVEGKSGIGSSVESLQEQFADSEIYQDFEAVFPIPEEGDYKLYLVARGGNPDDGYITTYAEGPSVNIIEKK